MISKDLWDKNHPATNPFLNYTFINALIKSGSATPDTGWSPVMHSTDHGSIYAFIKSHSYGEYIFDWGWAEAYSKYGIPYYPKLTSMVPFTPVTSAHFLQRKFNSDQAEELLKLHDHYYENNEFSSSHFLFLPKEEIDVFKKQNYMIRESMQYHFFNENYDSFDAFLETLKSKKAKTIRHERTFENLTIKKITGSDLTEEHARQMYQFYISTIAHKNSYDYLNEEFFKIIFSDMKENILYIEASMNDKAIAGSLFFFDHETLYGRYWGSTQYVDNLHFELCYYQGIDFCIEKKLKLFEAGAQGEHKIARGFRPVRTYSAHKIKHPGFKTAIEDFIEQEKKQVAKNIEVLSGYLPFKSKEI